MARHPSLGVWAWDTHVADIDTRGRPGQVICRYSADALDRWARGIPLLSCSMPVGDRPYRDAGVWFRGLLPEGQALAAMAAAAGVATHDTFAMLARFGRDVAGAVVISDTGPEAHHGSIEPYADGELDDEVAALDDRPLALHDDSELSLAGIQNKLLLVRDGDRWARPIAGRPSTHILKSEDRRYRGLVAAEAACLRLAKRIGLTTVDVEVDAFAGIDCLIVSRFDRSDTGGIPERIHQEDLCQATGRDASAARGRGKYESAGGPGFTHAAGLLDRYAADPVAELRRLVRVVTFTIAIGNGDAHGKNLAFLHDEHGEITLAPLYDTVPTAMWPALADRAAMSVGGRSALSRISRDDIVAEAVSWRLDPAVAIEELDATLTELVAALDETDVDGPLAQAIAARCDELAG